jgi:predicted CXXCH cytochrome family protein
LLLFLAVLAAAGGLFWWWRDRSPSPPEPLARPQVSDPRWTYQSPYRNSRPDVSYVGDDACTRCHDKIATTYHQHPMGRSLAPASRDPRDLEAPAWHNPFEADGLVYHIQRRGGAVFHVEEKVAADGKPLYRHEVQVDYAVGSGTRGRSYLTNRDGFVQQSPISWFTQSSRWDLSPGYRKGLNRHFDRPVPTECLFCHANQVAEVADTRNRYELPLFRGEAIGCERCHGPGELHVRDQQEGTIVNPKRLEPHLRNAICEQCHLQPERRVVRLGRDPFEYRPGLPLHLFVSDFVRRAALTDNYKAVGQVEQMHVSQCFQKSAGSFGCTSCHDPHRSPGEAEKVAHYRQRCVACHGQGAVACRLPRPDRERRTREDSCIVCHMPVANSSDIAHTSITDHRILRRPEASSAPPRPLRPGELPVVHFHRGLPDCPTDVDGRDLGIALADLAQRHQVVHAANLALPRLQACLKDQPTDVAALEAKASALLVVGGIEEAREPLDMLLRVAPRHENGLALAAEVAGARGKSDEALSLLGRLVEVNPYFAPYFHQLANVHFQRKDYRPALDAARRALELNPAHLEARRLVIACTLELGMREEARAAFEVYAAFKPADVEAVRAMLQR